MSAKKNAARVAVDVLLGVLLAGAQSREEDHKASILSLEIGMRAQEVLDRLGRMPDGRKDEKDEIIVC